MITHDIDVTRVDDEGQEYAAVATCEAVDNITFELIEGSIDTDIPQPAVSPPIKCEHYVRALRAKRQTSGKPFEAAYGQATFRGV